MKGKGWIWIFSAMCALISEDTKKRKSAVKIQRCARPYLKTMFRKINKLDRFSNVACVDLETK